MKNTDYHQARVDYSLESFQNDSIPRRYCLVLTNKCNLSCDFCFQHRRTLNGALNRDNWIHVIENVLPRGSHITLTGGEPLVFRGFKEVFVRANQLHTTNIISNGTRFNPELMELFATTENFQVLSISIDTVGNINRDVKIEQYQEMVRMLSLYRNLREFDGPRLDAKTVVTDDNAADLVDIFEHCANDLMVDSMSFQMLKGSPIQHADQCFDFSSIYNDPTPHIYSDPELIFSQFAKIQEKLKSVSIGVYTHPNIFDFSLTDDNSLARFVEELSSEKHEAGRYDVCRAPWESMHINANGDTFPCLAIKTGNILDVEDVGILYGSGVGQRFREQLRNCGTFPACSRCGYLKVNRRD